MYGKLAEKENFVDRVQERAMLKIWLSSGINVMIISPCRWGKSSLVKTAMDELTAEDKTIRVCHFDACSFEFESKEVYNWENKNNYTRSQYTDGVLTDEWRYETIVESSKKQTTKCFKMENDEWVLVSYTCTEYY